MNIIETPFPEVKLIEPKIFGDDRGFFFESWNQAEFKNAGIDVCFVQDNHSRSAKGVLRGLHYQIVNPQGKLVRVVCGKAWDVVVDIRKGSSNFGRWAAFELTAASKRLLWVPPGFAHGFMALEDDTDFIYKCTQYYAPEHERTILWSDCDLKIDWPGCGISPIVSPKDAAGMTLQKAELFA